MMGWRLVSEMGKRCVRRAMLVEHMIAAHQDRASATSKAAGMGSDGYLLELEKWTRFQWRSVEGQGWLGTWTA